jgi:hypothetical protein
MLIGIPILQEILGDRGAVPGQGIPPLDRQESELEWSMMGSWMRYGPYGTPEGVALRNLGHRAEQLTVGGGQVWSRTVVGRPRETPLLPAKLLSLGVGCPEARENFLYCYQDRAIQPRIRGARYVRLAAGSRRISPEGT